MDEIHYSLFCLKIVVSGVSSASWKYKFAYQSNSRHSIYLGHILQNMCIVFLLLWLCRQLFTGLLPH